jgi:SnoaL-like domain
MSEVRTHTESELLRLAFLYAKAMDRHDAPLLEQVMAPDVVIEGPGFVQTGFDEARRSPAMLRDMYLLTQHVVHNQTVTIDGDTAEGETYCTASHVHRPQGDTDRTTALVWSLRYQDRFVRTPAGWRFARRKLIVDWSETRPVTLGPQG